MARKRTKRDPGKAYIYIRVSSEKQAQSGLGLKDQEVRCRAYCVANGLQVVQVFRDEGVSAKHPMSKRPAALELLEKLSKYDVGSIVVLKLDRAFRSVHDATGSVADWDKQGVALHMVDFGGTAVNTGSAVGKLFLTMLAGFAEFERDLIGERTKAALRVKKANGERVGRIPYGYYERSDGKLLKETREQLALSAMIVD